MIDLFPFAGFPVGVLGLGNHGAKTAEILQRSGAEVHAWDDDEARRAEAEAMGLPINDLSKADWRDLVSLVVEPDVPHGSDKPHAIVTAARAGGCEVISDAELLARAQRDAKYVGVVSHGGDTELLDVLQSTLNVCGRDCEAGGDAARPILGLHALELGGIYVLSMPPGRIDTTMSITFDCAVLDDVGSHGWPPFETAEDALKAAKAVFRRQTGEKGAVVNADDRYGRSAYSELLDAKEQIVVPVSGKARVAGGVYLANKTLFDDMGGNDDAVIGLELAGQEDVRRAGLLAAAAYAALVILDVPPHAAMASIRSYFDEH